MPPFALTGAVYAIGNFDGVHRGHRALITQAQRLAQDLGRPHAALTFEPHPEDFFGRSGPVFRLTPPPLKSLALAECGLDGVVQLTFDKNLANLTPQAFVETILKRQLDAAAVVIGADFRFGQGRLGNVDTLLSLGTQHDFRVVVAEKVQDQGQDISSSLIRKALEQGHPEAAARWLGRPYRVMGEVISGQKLGRTLGTPTANIALEPTNRLFFGVYAVRVTLGEQRFSGVANFGIRPTVGQSTPWLETHIFDFCEDIYGQTLIIDFIAYLRPELRFESLTDLQLAIAQDIVKAREVLR